MRVGLRLPFLVLLVSRPLSDVFYICVLLAAHAFACFACFSLRIALVDCFEEKIEIEGGDALIVDLMLPRSITVYL